MNQFVFQIIICDSVNREHKNSGFSKMAVMKKPKNLYRAYIKGGLLALDKGGKKRGI